MQKPDQQKRAITTEERRERAVDHIQCIADAMHMWDGMPAEERRELTALIIDSLLEVVREHVPKYEHPTTGFKI